MLLLFPGTKFAFKLTHSYCTCSFISVKMIFTHQISCTINRQIFGPFLSSSVDLEMKIKKKRKICDDEKFVLLKISPCGPGAKTTPVMSIRVYTMLSEPCGWSSRPKRLTVWDTKTSRNCWNKPTGMSHRARKRAWAEERTVQLPLVSSLLLAY